LWQQLGFVAIGRIPDAFRHPKLGLVDAMVMYRDLDGPQSASVRAGTTP